VSFQLHFSAVPIREKFVLNLLKPFFLKLLLSAAATGLAIWFINLSVENFAGFKFSVTFAAMRYSYFLSFLVYVLSNTALVLMSSLVVCYYAPASAGSGIPEIKGYLNGIDMPGEEPIESVSLFLTGVFTLRVQTTAVRRVWIRWLNDGHEFVD
jgi:H+/Cl- antiporter ClcA